jgi:hypothetical protein
MDKEMTFISFFFKANRSERISPNKSAAHSDLIPG